LNHILTAMHGKKLAVIENEVGSISIDDALIAKNTKVQSDEEIVEMINGCICCNVRKDLITALNNLAKRVQDGVKLDGIIIEMTGMADPAPVAQTFFMDEDVRSFARIDGIIALVDAKHVEQHLDAELADGAQNETAAQLAFADRVLLNKIDLVDEGELDRIECRIRDLNQFAPIQRTQQSTVSVDYVLNVGGFDVQRALNLSPEFLEKEGDKFRHDKAIGSLAITFPEAVDLEMVNSWIGELIQNKGADLYRMKGVLNINHSDKRFVYQGVHMLFNGRFGDEWAEGEDRSNKLVFIGRNLDKSSLRQRFSDCIASEENIKKKSDALRFKVGDKVQCRTGPKDWSDGIVAALLYHDERMPPGMVAPYQIKLGDGSLIWAPSDEDCVIREPRDEVD